MLFGPGSLEYFQQSVEKVAPGKASKKQIKLSRQGWVPQQNVSVQFIKGWNIMVARAKCKWNYTTYPPLNFFHSNQKGNFVKSSTPAVFLNYQDDLEEQLSKSNSWLLNILWNQKQLLQK